jgi:hypothetical protein
MPKRNHEQLFDIAKRLSTDFEPWGQRSRMGEAPTQPDCSCHCRFFNRLDGGAGLDWGVCVNPLSLRAGLLTYQEFGCPHFEQPNSDDDDMPEAQ